MKIMDTLRNRPLSTFQIRVLAICFFLNMLDGMDVLAISFAAPVIATDWLVSPQALGIVFSSALVGMTIGAIFISPLSDRVGRRNMILLSVIIIALGMLATAFAQNITQLSLLRLVAGLGIGSMLASLTSMVSEYSPDKHRNFCILALQGTYPIGAIIAGFLAAWIVPDYGWRPLFVVAGCCSLLAIPMVFFFLPESLDFLLSYQPRHALVKVNRILECMAIDKLTRLPKKNVASGSGSKFALVLSKPLRSASLTLWLSFFMSFATLYFLFSWVVKLAVEAGLSPERAMYAGISLNMGAFFGSITLGYFSSRFSLKKTIAIFFYLGAIMTAIYAFFNTHVVLVMLQLFFLMFFVLGAFTGLYAVAARLYATEIRTTGVGCAIGIGRAGAIVGPALAGLILGTGTSVTWVFVIFSLPLLVAAMAVSRINSSSIN